MSKFDVFSTKFAWDVYSQKYSLDFKEGWRDTCHRVATNVMAALGYGPNHELTKEVEELIYLRYMIPGGRYLRSAGRAVSNIKNCICFGVEDTAEAWSDHLRKVSLSLMYGLGDGAEYTKCRGKGTPLKSKGGYASGPVPLMRMVDGITGEVMAGGDRRGANLAQLAWHHPDIFDFLVAKNWDDETLDRLSKNWNAYAPLKYTNISVRYGDEFLKAYAKNDPHAKAVFDANIYQMVRTGEPGIICNFGDKKKDIYTNACQPGFATVLTQQGVATFDDLKIGDFIWSGKQWTKVVRKWCSGVKPVFLYKTWAGVFIGTPSHRVVSYGIKVEAGHVSHIDRCPDPSEPNKQPLPTEITERTYIGDMKVYDITVEADEHTYWTGGLLVSNCGEFRHDKDSATCNLVAPNWARIPNLNEFKRVIEMASLLAVAGNSYSYYPLAESKRIAEEDNDIGIGAMGMAAWFSKRGYKYGEESEELDKWLEVYSTNIDLVKPYCDRLGVATPKRGRAIAPTGSISILGETSGGIEPIFCVSYKRKVIKGGTTMMSEYVIDPVARELIDSGVSPDSIEDAYTIPFERRIAFQAKVQDYVDMGISSTLNLPKWGSEGNNESTVEEFKRCVLKYLPRLRGLTTFPDGSRGSAQPLTPVKYSTAIKYAGQGLVEDSVQICDLRGGGCNT